ncbi:hypothetical protein GCM10022243_25240 [Saccharothrix violaceirubra]
MVEGLPPAVADKALRRVTSSHPGHVMRPVHKGTTWADRFTAATSTDIFRFIFGQRPDVVKLLQELLSATLTLPIDPMLLVDELAIGGDGRSAAAGADFLILVRAVRGNRAGP